MFAHADLALALPLHTATEALDRALADGGLTAESRRAMADGLQFVMPVGPRGSAFPARQVEVRLLPARWVGQRRVVILRWETTGPTGRMFPALDADLDLAAGDDRGVCKLSIVGCYEAPMAAAGETIDKIMMSKVASATMNALLREVAAQLHKWVE